MGEHDFRVNLDKAQRDDLLQWLIIEIEMREQDVLGFYKPRPAQHDLRILKSLKAMVESFDTSGKQVEDSGDVRHEQKTVTKKEIDELGKELSCSHNEEMWLIPLLHRRLKELGIPVLSFDTTEKQVEDSGSVRHEQKGVTKNWVAEVLDSIDDYEG